MKKVTDKDIKFILKRYAKTFKALADYDMEKQRELKFMFAVVSKDSAGETIQLFKTKKQAEQFYEEYKARIMKEPK